MPDTIPIFDGVNYEFWSVKMRTLLLSMDLWDTVENGYHGETNREKQQRDAAALSKIQQGVSDLIFPRIMKATKAKEAWDILQEFQTHGRQTGSINNRPIRVPTNITKSRETNLIVATLIATVTFTAVLTQLYTMTDHPILLKKQLGLAFAHTAYAMIAMWLAFITGTYAVLAPSSLSISVCVIPSILLFNYLFQIMCVLPKAKFEFY
ncbi:uncharacterized protein LOC114322344 isoform X2 [Camellia sinensis]|uniref:uncharacterized protein LOC114322344 isoform X2 n=1 Tax=Camellia sinensis TaxID=4442 RepID=UPI0010356794|nr:uncharacterized protein LOC114322344 isoform X2 [Camellia sinensis]